MVNLMEYVYVVIKTVSAGELFSNESRMEVQVFEKEEDAKEYYVSQGMIQNIRVFKEKIR